MPAEQIPNLLTLRGRRARTGRRASRTPRAGGPSDNEEADPLTPEEYQAELDERVRLTDVDANFSRLCAVQVGYLKDDYASEFHLGRFPRRIPIINRGTYVRTVAVDRLVESFILSNAGRYMQIISLGAGTDTRYWRLREKKLHINLLYHEIDYPSTSAHKLDAVRSSKKLSPPPSSFFVLHHVPNIRPTEGRWGFFRDGPIKRQGYLFHPYDLRKLPAKLPDLVPDVPTLLISECTLCYLTNSEAKNVISNFTNQVPTIGIVLYEPTNPFDQFGTMMRKNLASRHLVLPSMTEYPSIEAQKQRLAKAQFVDYQNGGSISWLWKNWVTEEERVRTSKLEMVDEVEEWELLSSHYLVMWAYRELGEPKGAFEQWKSFKGELYDPSEDKAGKEASGQGDKTDPAPEDDNSSTPTENAPMGLGIA